MTKYWSKNRDEGKETMRLLAVVVSLPDPMGRRHQNASPLQCAQDDNDIRPLFPLIFAFFRSQASPPIVPSFSRDMILQSLLAGCLRNTATLVATTC